MKTVLLTTLMLLFFLSLAEAQEQKGKLKVFIDCSNTFCDQTFIRSEINMVDFLLDRVAADVHVLITSQNTGSGGDQFQLLFIGQHAFMSHQDTLRFSTDPNVTDFEEREQLLLYLKLGLTPLVAKTSQAAKMSITMKSEVPDEVADAVTKDKWNYWVYEVGGNGNLDANQVYKSLNLEGRIRVSRITEAFKTKIRISNEVIKESYESEDDNGDLVSEKVYNSNFSATGLMVWSLTDRVSIGYTLGMENSTFSNYKVQAYLLPQIEYAFFPYKEVNTKYFALRYGIGAQYNHYYDTTIYDKLSEGLIGQNASLTLGLNQKWGTVNAQLRWQNYFHDWSVNNLRLSSGADVRITGGLSFYVYFFGGLVHDQINLKSEGASESDVLTRRRQLATSFEFGSFVGLNFRFGSKLNNFVNPRFEGPDW